MRKEELMPQKDLKIYQMAVGLFPAKLTMMRYGMTSLKKEFLKGFQSRDSSKKNKLRKLSQKN